jgi:hypothetical protein
MKEQGSENSLPPSQSAGKPHFDDERTILTARPVVPLDQIDKKLKLKSHCFVAGAFTVAMLLGGASGLISAYYKLRAVRDSGVAQVDVPTQAASEEPLASTVPKVAVTEASNASSLPVFEEQASNLVIPKRVVRPRPVTQRTNNSVGSQPLSEDEELSRIRQDVLLDEWQERRMRGPERREQRRSERKRNAMIY